MENVTSKSIAVFDSGVGGLTVMQQIIKKLPKETLIYFGDTARLPYGNKSPETIIRYTLENAQFLMQHEIKMLVIACNTASAYSLGRLQEHYNVPIIGVVKPGASKAVEMTRSGRIAVLGTKATIQSGVYQQEIKRLLPSAVITAIACPLFVPLVEENFITSPATQLIVKEYLEPLKYSTIDTLVLGCTHYPLLRPVIEQTLGPSIQIVDSAQACSEMIASTLQQLCLGKTGECEQPLAHRFFVTDDPNKFTTLGQEFLGMPLKQVSLVSL